MALILLALTLNAAETEKNVTYTDLKTVPEEHRIEFKDCGWAVEGSDGGTVWRSAKVVNDSAKMPERLGRVQDDKVVVFKEVFDVESVRVSSKKEVLIKTSGGTLYMKWHSATQRDCYWQKLDADDCFRFRTDYSNW